MLPAISDKRSGRENDDKTKQKSEKHLFLFYCRGIIMPSDIDSVEMRIGLII